MKTAVTGGIGSGKSHVCWLLREQGIEIYDCDSAAKILMRTSQEIKCKLKSLVGDDVYCGDGINKPVLTRFLLAGEDNKRAVNAIVHPAVARDFEKSGMEWMECAILFESGFDHLVDRIVCITAPRQLRIERIMRRDGITRERRSSGLTARCRRRRWHAAAMWLSTTTARRCHHSSPYCKWHLTHPQKK